MRCAPSVTYPVGRSAVFGTALLALAVAGLLLLLVWGWQASIGSDGAWWIVATAWMAWVGWAYLTWSQTSKGTLVEWDSLANSALGEKGPGAWFLRGPSHADEVPLARVHVVLDWQRGMLLRLTDMQGTSTWVWVEQIRCQDRWLDLRRALVSSGSA